MSMAYNLPICNKCGHSWLFIWVGSLETDRCKCKQPQDFDTSNDQEMPDGCLLIWGKEEEVK